MSEILVIYLIVSGCVCAAMLPIMYYNIYCDLYHSFGLELISVSVIGFILGWLLFPIIFLVSLFKVINKIVKIEKQRNIKNEKT